MCIFFKQDLTCDATVNPLLDGSLGECTDKLPSQTYCKKSCNPGFYSVGTTYCNLNYELEDTFECRIFRIKYIYLFTILFFFLFLSRLILYATSKIIHFYNRQKDQYIWGGGYSCKLFWGFYIFYILTNFTSYLDKGVYHCMAGHYLAGIPHVRLPYH